MRIANEQGEAFMGEGLLELLQMIVRHGSILHAAKVMPMSYVKALEMLNRLERSLGQPVARRKTGGALGGGTRLTPFGVVFMKAYERYSGKVRRFADRELENMLNPRPRR